ncbi:MAG: type II secretion system F family protein [Candidatus Nomurabacteria bacterium]|nr:type II secretion system F family protein [Candidatus Nomurabacteria bacterium]
MLFTYKAITNTNEKKEGSVEALSRDTAITALQRRGLIVISIEESGKPKNFLEIRLFDNVPMKDIVIMSRQISTLFEASVSALKAFSLLAGNTQNHKLSGILNNICEDIQAGTSINAAMAKHPDVFSEFYTNMVKAGEESGKMTQTFTYLADYLERQYQLTSKTKNALIYPAFVIGVFFLVMILMFTFIVPKLTAMIKDSGQAIPPFTKVIMGISDLFVSYGIFMLIFFAIGVFLLYRFMTTEKGKYYMDNLKISVPVVKNIYQKLYLSRMADNMDTMLSSGIPIVRSIELTAAVVGNRVYAEILKNTTEMVKSGSSLSEAFAKHEEIPAIMTQMIRVGEETGSLGNILKTLGHFYNREVQDAVDTMVGLIEPIMIVGLGLGVGILLSAILMPIYNIAGGM